MTNENKTFKVYKHTNIINGKIYVGITCRNPKIRWANGKGYGSNIFFSRAIKKYGWNKGKKHSEESKLKMSKSHFGRIVSLETKRKMSTIMLNNSNSKKVICIETGEVFPSIAEAGRKLNLSSGNINAVCLGKRNSTGKLHFKYYNGDKNEK